MRTHAAMGKQPRPPRSYPALLHRMLSVCCAVCWSVLQATVQRASLSLLSSSAPSLHSSRSAVDREHSGVHPHMIRLLSIVCHLQLSLLPTTQHALLSLFLNWLSRAQPPTELLYACAALTQAGADPQVHCYINHVKES